MRWAVGGASPLPFGDGAFDALFAGELIEHLPDPAARVAEFQRVPRPGGTLILTTPNRLRLANLADRSERPYSPDHLSELSFDEARSLLPAGDSRCWSQPASISADAELALANAEARPAAAPVEQAVGDPSHARVLAVGALAPRYSLDLIFVARRAIEPGATPRAAGLAAAALVVLCLRWFEGPHPLPRVGRGPLRASRRDPAHRRRLVDLRPPVGAGADVATGRRRGLAVGRAALAFRLPLAWHGAAGYVTADGSLSGIVALRPSAPGSTTSCSCPAFRTAAA